MCSPQPSHRIIFSLSPAVTVHVSFFQFFLLIQTVSSVWQKEMCIIVSGLSHEVCDSLVNTTQSIDYLIMVSYLEINYNLSIISFCLVYEKWIF